MFDPLSSWLVTLIADGAIFAKEHSGGNLIAEYERKRIESANAMLNADIHRVKKDYGLRFPEQALERIESHTKAIKETLSLIKNGASGIIIDLENQDYIINLLEACERECLRHEHTKAEAEKYKRAADKAKVRRNEFAKSLELKTVDEAKKQEEDSLFLMVAIACVIGLFMMIMVL